jgi:2-hydroxy-3-oxopropionate reductase
MSQDTIGFIGLGIMGRPMAHNLLRAGHPLVVHNRSPEPVRELVAAGATEALSPREVAQRSQVIITMLPDSPDVEQVALGPGGLIEGVAPGDVHVDMSTIAPSAAITVASVLADKGTRCLDAPVSGGELGAVQGTLSIMVGGDEETFDDMLPIFRVLGQTITLCGPLGAGQTVKACNQIQVALNIMGMAESLVLGAKAGVDPAIVLRVLSGGYAQCRVMDARGSCVVAGDFDPGFKSRFHYKDLNIALRTGRESGVPLPVTGLAQQLFGALQAAGRGDLDHTAIITVLEDLAGVKARTRE